MVSDRSSLERAFGKLVFRTYRLVLWHFVQRGVPLQEAEDLTQDTFLSAFRAFADFRGETSADRWLLTIAQNRWRNWIRTHKADKRSGLEVSFDSRSEEESLALLSELVDEDGLVRDTLNTEKIDIVRRAVDELPSQMRRCATLRLFQGLTYSEVAATLQISVDAVKVQLFRARKRIRSRMGDYLDEPVRGAR